MQIYRQRQHLAISKTKTGQSVNFMTQKIVKYDPQGHTAKSPDRIRAFKGNNHGRALTKQLINLGALLGLIELQQFSSEAALLALAHSYQLLIQVE